MSQKDQFVEMLKSAKCDFHIDRMGKIIVATREFVFDGLDNLTDIFTVYPLAEDDEDF